MNSVRLNNIYIKKRPLPVVLTFLIFFLPFLLSFLQDVLMLPNAVKYLIDVSVLLTFFFILFSKKIFILNKLLIPFAFIVIGFFLLTAIVYLFNFQSPFYYLWGLRNNFRFYIAFFAYIFFFDEADTNSCFKAMDFLFWVNAAVSLYQFFALGYKQDFLGGIFGVEKGCNSYSLVFFSIVIAKSVLSLFSDRESIFLCILKCATALLISALAELKLFFIIFVIIVFFSVFFTKFTWKNLILCLFSIFLVGFASIILSQIFGEHNRLSIDRIIELITATNYSSANDLGRFTAISTISETILTNPISKIFGLGLGNCDTSAFAICNSKFFIEHEYLNYNWFSSAFMFLENGYLGFMIYLSFFFTTFFSAFFMRKKPSANKLYCQLSMIISVLSVILVFYNSSLRTEVAYIVYFALALPFIGCNRFQS